MEFAVDDVAQVVLELEELVLPIFRARNPVEGQRDLLDGQPRAGMLGCHRHRARSCVGTLHARHVIGSAGRVST